MPNFYKTAEVRRFMMQVKSLILLNDLNRNTYSALCHCYGYDAEALAWALYSAGFIHWSDEYNLFSWTWTGKNNVPTLDDADEVIRYRVWPLSESHFFGARRGSDSTTLGLDPKNDQTPAPNIPDALKRISASLDKINFRIGALIDEIALFRLVNEQKNRGGGVEL